MNNFLRFQERHQMSSRVPYNTNKEIKCNREWIYERPFYGLQKLDKILAKSQLLPM